MASDKADFVAAIDVWSAARAWQAFRDFLNGVDDGEMEQWRKRVRNAVGVGASMGRELR